MFTPSSSSASRGGPALRSSALRSKMPSPHCHEEEFTRDEDTIALVKYTDQKHNPNTSRTSSSEEVKYSLKLVSLNSSSTRVLIPRHI